MSNAAITASVGKGGVNKHQDVVTIQKLLNQNIKAIAPTPLLKADGQIGSKTISAIEAFQRKVMGIASPDGRVDPGGRTIKKLGSAETTGIAWPLKTNVIRGRKNSNTFGMVRNGGKRAHQGWDFEAKKGTAAYAVADGTVEFIKNSGDYGLQMCMSFKYKGKTYYAFYAHMQKTDVKKGDRVSVKQKIGTCGKTGNASNLPASENHLHFEIRTQLNCGLGLGGRVSPMKIYGKCPLNAPVHQA